LGTVILTIEKYAVPVAFATSVFGRPTIHAAGAFRAAVPQSASFAFTYLTRTSLGVAALVPGAFALRTIAPAYILVVVKG
jgi:hypothetical protein